MDEFNLDPVDVYMQDFEKGKGQITITCYGSAWTIYFGAMGNKTIQEFFAEAGTDYLVNKLTDRSFQKCTKQHEKYLTRIVNAVKEALKEKP